MTATFDSGLTAGTSLLYVFLPFSLFFCVAVKDKLCPKDTEPALHAVAHTHTRTHTRTQQPRSDPASVLVCNETKRTDAELPKSPAGSRRRAQP